MVEPETFIFPADGRIPNSALPTLVYRGVAPTDQDNAEAMLEGNGWPCQWRTAAGFFTFQHYHSNVHEVVSVVRGIVVGRLGGENGKDLSIEPGDVVVLPAGTGHLHVYASSDLMMLGGYPNGSEEWNIHRGVPTVYGWAKSHISRVEIPTTDPVYGKNGPLVRLWQKQAT